jgi:hypothetical protein
MSGVVTGSGYQLIDPGAQEQARAAPKRGV